MVKRCSQSGSTVSPKMARGFVFGGSSSARANPAPRAPATRPVTVRRKCLRGNRRDCGKERRWVVFMILLDKFGAFSIHVRPQLAVSATRSKLACFDQLPGSHAGRLAQD